MKTVHLVLAACVHEFATIILRSAYLGHASLRSMMPARAASLGFLFGLTVSVLLTLFLGAARAQICASGAVPCFQGLGTTYTAAAVNSNAIVVGSALTGPTVSQAATWISGTITPLGFLPSCVSPCSSSATGISANGSVVVGSSTDANGNTQAVRWVNGGISGLGYLPGCTSSCGTQATGVSSDGSTVVGWGNNSSSQAFSWSNGALAILQPPCSGIACFSLSYAQADAVNSNGSVIVGLSYVLDGSFGPTIWTNGTPAILQAPCSGGFCGVAYGVNADGSVVVGKSEGFLSGEATIWINGTPSFLNFFPGVCQGEACSSIANGVSSDGSVVVGSAGAGNLAWVWTSTIGMQSVQTILGSCGGINTAGWTLTSAVAISGDGKTIVGIGIDPSGATESWIARLQFSMCSVAPPTVAGISPQRGLPAGGTTVLIAGTNLAGATAVTFGTTPATAFTVNSPTSITATSPAGYGTVDVTVTTTSGTSATSAADQFAFLPAAHDFNGDGKSDIAWRNVDGDVAIWLMNGTQVLNGPDLGNVATTWAVVGQRDFNGDGYSDLLWRNANGDVAMWFMNGTQLLGGPYLGNVTTDWSIVGTGDFNGDGMGDILWRDADGDVAIWLMNGTQVLNGPDLGNVSNTWTIAGTGDFNGDGFTDILWRNADGDVAIWFMKGTQVLSGPDLGNVPTSWTVVGTGDFNGDGKSDILWRNTNGDVAIWLMNGTQILNGPDLGNVSNSWTIVETGDYNGDGFTDILWRNLDGDVAIWFMNGTQVLSDPDFVNIPTNWTIQGAGAD